MTGWPTALLGDVCEISMGQAPAGDTYNDDGDGVPLIAGAGDFRKGVPVAGKFTSQPTKLARRGDIILSIRASIGDRVLADREYCLGRGVAGLRPGVALHRSYLWHWLSWAAGALAAKGRGATFLQVNRSDIGDMPIPLPPLPEQRRIADILDRADALRAKRREALALLDDLAQSIFLDMFERSEATWPEVTVNDLVDAQRGGIRTGPFGSQLLHSEFVESGIAVLGIDNAVSNRFSWGKSRFITSKKYEQLRRYTVFPGDLLITIMGTCGRAAIVPREIPKAVNTKHLCCITLDHTKCLPEFLHAYFLRHPDAIRYLEAESKGAIMSGLNMGIIRQLPVALPTLRLQQQYVDKIVQVEKTAAISHEALYSASALFSALQSQAFSGQL